MWRDAAVVAAKDLRIEGRAKVALNQVVPYSLVVLLLFGFAFDQDRPLLVQAAPGLFWLAVLFSGLLAVQRSFAIETADGAVDRLRMSGLEPAGVFLGKAAAVALELIVLEALLAGGIVVLFHSKLAAPACWLPAHCYRRPGWPLRVLPMGRCRWASACGRRCCRCCWRPCWHRSSSLPPRPGGPPLAFRVKAPRQAAGVGSGCSLASLRSTWLAES